MLHEVRGKKYFEINGEKEVLSQDIETTKMNQTKILLIKNIAENCT